MGKFFKTIAQAILLFSSVRNLDYFLKKFTLTVDWIISKLNVPDIWHDSIFDPYQMILRIVRLPLMFWTSAKCILLITISNGDHAPYTNTMCNIVLCLRIVWA